MTSWRLPCFRLSIRSHLYSLFHTVSLWSDISKFFYLLFLRFCMHPAVCLTPILSTKDENETGDDAGNSLHG